MTSLIGIAGEGAWGRALAHVARESGNETIFWSRRWSNPEVLAGADAIILAVPAQSCRDVLQRIAPAIRENQPVIISAKGIEQTSGKFIHEILAEIVPEATAMVLSGPSFAADVVRGLPTAVTLAAATLDHAAEWAERLSCATFRIYRSDDILGVEIGGALKNVLAIACGISDGRKLGDSARAALTTRGFAELTRFGRALGARPETLIGLSGLGDLLLTCSSRQSRNYSFGFRIGEGQRPAEALAAIGTVEGAATAAIAASLARQHRLDMPIVNAVNAIVDGGSSPGEEIARLMQRPLRAEFLD
jgi:glycerol-3-phosphate dehydrogenase (NAD(P)+)